ncbi:hypothetical protein NPS01_32350 [Nocardioides psychrotolerans]|uniref:Heat shock protein HslJ n=1 Tax=Nocardioides psychrotolerans TaxID=1005945 RepID=A0A1I3NZF7_9ACTN|nr:META domain-containing protein [Nocardioides psychrotolerans]GEP39572.1 hypothetical protein NPS01_32350 [Nocardioides psychrotolerans]SFJ14695.1 Heat shock protein HslJ [Nocardioides psychrotolerans]
MAIAGRTLLSDRVLVRLRGCGAQHRHQAAVALALAILVGCAAGAFAWTSVRDKDTEGRWLLESGIGVPGSGPASEIVIEGDQIRGDGPCNSFGATWSQDDGVSGLMTTLIGCAPDVLLLEDRYFELLDGATSVDVTDDRMVLSGPGGTLSFTRST